MRRRIKPVVLRVLKNDPLAREDDNHLICAVCHEMGLELLPEHVRLIEELPRLSSIVRTRAKIQQQGRFLPSPDVMRERRPYRRKRTIESLKTKSKKGEEADVGIIG